MSLGYQVCGNKFQESQGMNIATSHTVLRTSLSPHIIQVPAQIFLQREFSGEKKRVYVKDLDIRMASDFQQ